MEITTTLNLILLSDLVETEGLVVGAVKIFWNGFNLCRLWGRTKIKTSQVSQDVNFLVCHWTQWTRCAMHTLQCCIVLLSWNEQWMWIFSYIAASQLTHHNHNSSSNNNCLNSSVVAHNFLVISLEDILPHFQGRATDIFDYFLWKDLCLPLFLATSTPFPRILIRPLPWKDLRSPDYFWRPLLPSREPAHFRGWSFTSLLFSEETRRAPQ